MSAFVSPADLLAAGLRLPPVKEPAHDLPPGSLCAITGQPIRRGYRVADMVTDATAEFLDTFRGGVHGHVSESAARCFRSANPRAGNPCARSQVAFAGGVLWQPLVNRDSARAQDRPCWSDLVRAIWRERAGQTCLLLLTTDTKKRLWPKARVGALGARTPLLIHDGDLCLSETRLLDWPALLECLDLLETVYTAGFAKPAIRHGLPTATKATAAAGLAQTLAWERALVGWRARPEFAPALLMAQRWPVETPSAALERPDGPALVSRQEALL